MSALPCFWARAALVGGRLEVSYPMPQGRLGVADAALVEITVLEGGERGLVMMLCPRSAAPLVATIMPPGSSSRILSLDEALRHLSIPCRLMFACPQGHEDGVTLDGRPVVTAQAIETRGDA